MYHGNLDKKGLKNCWLKLPKIIFWHILIERNQRIFLDKAQLPDKIAAKSQALMGEMLNVSLFSKNKTKLSLNKVNWLHSINISELDTAIAKRPLEVWEIILEQY